MHQQDIILHAVWKQEDEGYCGKLSGVRESGLLAESTGGNIPAYQPDKSFFIWTHMYHFIQVSFHSMQCILCLKPNAFIGCYNYTNSQMTPSLNRLQTCLVSNLNRVQRFFTLVANITFSQRNYKNSTDQIFVILSDNVCLGNLLQILPTKKSFSAFLAINDDKVLNRNIYRRFSRSNS